MCLTEREEDTGEGKPMTRRGREANRNTLTKLPSLDPGDSSTAGVTQC